MTNKNSSYLTRNFILLLVLLIITFFVSYLYRVKQHDRELANQVYQELVVIDGQLDKLQESAQRIITENKINSQLATVIAGLNKENFFVNKVQLLEITAQLNYDLNGKQKIESEIRAADPSNVKAQIKLIKETMREIKYQHNLEITAFNQQIGQITTKVGQIKDQIAKIKTKDLQQLEVAKLNFIAKKLNKTAHLISNNFFNVIFDDVVGAAINAAESRTS